MPTATDRQIEIEDLPASSLAQMVESLGVPSVDFATPPENTLIRGHQVAGNVIRPDPVCSISADETRREYFSIPGQMSMYLLVLPLMIRYRYRL
ncbi:MAG TPA: hypothetical protein VJQ82_10725 [Terriglobales bacterium]|nr:hypothetical protein [Terriglobales bacterium]